MRVPSSENGYQNASIEPTVAHIPSTSPSASAQVARYRRNMYVCMYVCTYVRMYARMYVCMHVCMYLCMYLCMYPCTYVCTHVRSSATAPPIPKTAAWLTGWLLLAGWLSFRPAFMWARAWRCPSVNSFKFEPCDHTLPGTQRLRFLIRC